MNALSLKEIKSGPNFGFAVVGIFIASWIVSTLVRSRARCHQPRQVPKLYQLERRDLRTAVFKLKGLRHRAALSQSL